MSDIKPEVLLAYGTDNPAVSSVNPVAARHAAELRAKRDQQSISGKEALLQKIAQAEQKQPVFISEQAELLKIYFGGGEARINPQSKAAEISPGATADEIAIFTEAQKVVNNLSLILSYCEVMRAQNPTDKLNSLIGLQPPLPHLSGIRTLDVLRNQVLNIIDTDPSMQRLFPELYAHGIDPVRRRNYLDQALVLDKNFHLKLAERISAAHSALQKLQKVEDAQPVREAKQRLAQEEATYDKQVNQLMQILKGLNLSSNLLVITDPGGSSVSLDINDRQQIKNLLETGDLELVKERIFRGILGCSRKEYEEIMDLNWNLPRQIQEIESEMQKKVAPFAQNPNAQQILNSDPVYQHYSQTYNALKQRQNTLEGTYRGHQLDSLFNSKILPLLTSGASQQNPEGAFLALLSQAKSQAASIEFLKQQVASLESQHASEKEVSRIQRILSEKKILADLQGIIGPAVVDVMEQRYDEVLPLEQKRQEEEAKKAQERKGAKIAVAQRRIQQEMNERWIKIDPNTGKTIDCDNIRSDLNLLIYQGENGLKRLFMRNIFGSGTRFNVLRIDPTTGNKTQVQVEWSTFNFTTDELIGEDKELFDTVYAAESANYRKKLMTDYFLARSSGRIARLLGRHNIIGSTDLLNLRDFEWEALDRNFGKDVSDALSASKEAQGVIKKLEQSGIKPSPKLKWLIGVLAGLGIGGAALFFLFGLKP
jgi:hypothetical protein